jgi:uncharacterized protein involved in exopolysaccharide biosynthesis
MLTPYRAPESLQEQSPAAFEMIEQGGLPEQAEGVNWARLLAALHRYKWLILVIVALGSVAGALSIRLLDPEYQVGATIYINDGGGQTGDRNGPIRANALLQTSGWVELLRSFAVVDPVVQRMKLYLITSNERDVALFNELKLAPRYRPGHYKLEIDREANRYALLTGKDAVEKGVLGDSIGRRIGIQWAPSAASLDGRTSVEFELITPREASVELSNRLAASLPEQSNFLRVRLSGTQSSLTAATLNEWLRQYVAVAADMKRKKMSELTRDLHVQFA